MGLPICSSVCRSAGVSIRLLRNIAITSSHCPFCDIVGFGPTYFELKHIVQSIRPCFQERKLLQDRFSSLKLTKYEKVSKQKDVAGFARILFILLETVTSCILRTKGCSSLFHVCSKGGSMVFHGYFKGGLWVFFLRFRCVCIC